MSGFGLHTWNAKTDKVHHIPHLCLKRKNSVWLRLVIEQGKIKRITYIVPKELRNPREGFKEDAEF